MRRLGSTAKADNPSRAESEGAGCTAALGSSSRDCEGAALILDIKELPM